LLLCLFGTCTTTQPFSKTWMQTGVYHDQKWGPWGLGHDIKKHDQEINYGIYEKSDIHLLYIYMCTGYLFLYCIFCFMFFFLILIFIYCLICCRSRGAGPNDTQVSKACAEACITATALLWSHVFVGGELLGPLVERWAGRWWLHFVDIDIRSICKLPTSGFFLNNFVMWCN
jgi:hypothetical protein